MKVEINNENKAKFFALYWDQKLMVLNFHYSTNTLCKVSVETICKAHNYRLLLNPLSEISKEDAIECGFMFNVDPKKVVITFYFDDYDINWVSSFEGNRKEGVLLLKDFDYLRSKGYALPWMGLSVEEMVEAGWIKLA